MGKKIEYAKKLGATKEDIELLRLYYKRAKFYRRGMPTACSKCGAKFYGKSIVCMGTYVALCLKCYDKMYVEVD